MSLSTHVLDATAGRPAVGVTVRLESRTGDGWREVATGSTDDDGRLRDWLPAGTPGTGVHRLVFDTGAYFADRPKFYPEVVVVFEVGSPDEHYHVPILLSPFAFSTYRGS